MISYGMNVSADGYVVDDDGKYDWSVPSDDLFAFYIGVQRDSVLDVYGRRLYDEMRFWKAPPEGTPADVLEYAEAWQATPKLIVSSTLESVDYGELVRDVSAVEDRDGPVQIGGAGLAASMIDRIDEFVPVVYPVVVGGGVPFFPAGARLDLKLVETRRFDSGPVLLRYQRA